MAEIDALLAQAPGGSAQLSVSLASGTEWGADPNQAALGSLEIANGTSYDAAVALVPAGALHDESRWIYVKAGESSIMRHVGAGTYMLLFCSGLDWDKAATTFREHAAFAEFTEPFSWEERSENNAIAYSEQKVTLHAVVHGNARTRAMTRAEVLMKLRRR